MRRGLPLLVLLGGCWSPGVAIPALGPGLLIAQGSQLFVPGPADSLPVFDMGDPMGESTCVACGECVQACPTGALAPAKNAYLKPVDKKVDSGLKVVTKDNLETPEIQKLLHPR